MPFVHLDTPTGVVDIHYYIATPTSTTALSIDKTLPTVIFLHGLFTGSPIFESQFCDPQLRQFNLVSVDMRAHGETKGLCGKPYTTRESAEDVLNLMKALDLPPSHVVGLSIGTHVALEMAISQPKMFLSCIVCSPMSLVESEFMLEGRKEVCDIWVQTFEGGDPDEQILADVLVASAQLCFNHLKTPVVEAITAAGVAYAMELWAYDNIDQSYAVTVEWIASRRSLHKDDLSKIQCPVTMIHCSGDVAYTLDDAKELERRLIDANVKVSLTQVEGAHYGVICNPEKINPIIRESVLANTNIVVPPLQDKAPRMRTPFYDLLKKHGFDPDSDLDDDDELLLG